MPPRRSKDPWTDAEAVFKPVAPPYAPPPAAAAAPVPGAREAVTLRVDQDVLFFFQEDGPGWQDRMVEALRKAAGL